METPATKGSLKPYLMPFLRSITGAALAFGCFVALLSYLPNETQAGGAAAVDQGLNPRVVCGAAASLGAVIAGFWPVFTAGTEFNRPMVTGVALSFAVVTLLCITL